MLGRHRGIVRYTVGQRKGLGIASSAPLFVTVINPDANTVTLTHGEGLSARGVTAQDFNLISVPSIRRPLRVRARVRFRQREVPATAVETPEGLRVEFDEPLRAPTVGQALVLYDMEEEDVVVGGGTISGVVR